MTRIIIDLGEIGLVMDPIGYVRAVPTGVHWLGWREHVDVYSMDEPFEPLLPLAIYIGDNRLANLLNYIDVCDSELAIVYRNGKMCNVLEPGTYAYWRGPVKYSYIKIDLNKIEITEPIDLTGRKHKLLVPFIRTYKVENYESATLVRGQ